MNGQSILEPQHSDTRLDVARGVSALVVFAGHLGQVLIWRLVGPDTAFAAICEVAGRHAVLVFFLLSGHLITRSVLSNIKRNRRFSIGDYVTARVARIYPPLIGAVLICMAVWAAIHALHMPGGQIPFGLPGDLYRISDYVTLDAKEIERTLTIQGGMLIIDTPLWSLFIEVQIYGVVLAIAAFWQPDWIARCWTTVIGLAAVILLRDQKFLVLLWALGALTAVMPVSRRIGWIAAVGSALIVLAMALYRPELLRREMLTPPGLAVQAACSVLYGAILFYAYPKWRYPTPLVTTANFSYSLYVAHFPLVLLALSASQDWVGHALGRALLTVLLTAIAILGFIVPYAALVERPHQIKALLLRLIPSKGRHGTAYAAASLVLLAGICMLSVYRHVQQCRPAFDEHYTYIPPIRSPAVARVILIRDMTAYPAALPAEPLFQAWVRGLTQMGADMVVLDAPAPYACWFSDGGRSYRDTFLLALAHIKADAAARHGQPHAVLLSGMGYGGLHVMQAFAADPKAYIGWQAALTVAKVNLLPNMRDVGDVSDFNAFEIAGTLRGTSGFLSWAKQDLPLDRGLAEHLYDQVRSPGIEARHYSGPVQGAAAIADLLSNARMQLKAPN